MDVQTKYLRQFPVFFFIALFIFHVCSASKGDTSNVFRGCFHTCHFNNCSKERDIQAFRERQNVLEKLLSWKCMDECRYKCMWKTTDHFLAKNWPVPQFNGKWPFIRLFGLQEPASVLFSLLNAASHLVNMKRFRKVVPSNAPLYWFWHSYFMVCVHAWFWSVVFHSRDLPFTELMDYFSAFSMVLFSFVAFLIRSSGKGKRRRKGAIIGLGLLLFWIHVRYLTSSSRFDYGYNMKVNVLVGTLNGLGWLYWSWTRSVSRKYVKWCQYTVILLGCSMALELLDFAPVFWVLDAHALWHLSTAFLPYLWYRFIEGDCYYLLENESKFQTSKKFA